MNSNLIVNQPIKSLVEDFFLFNTFLSKNSKNLQNCSAQARLNQFNFVR